MQKTEERVQTISDATEGKEAEKKDIHVLVVKNRLEISLEQRRPLLETSCMSSQTCQKHNPELFMFSCLRCFSHMSEIEILRTVWRDDRFKCSNVSYFISDAVSRHICLLSLWLYSRKFTSYRLSNYNFILVKCWLFFSWFYNFIHFWLYPHIVIYFYGEPILSCQIKVTFLKRFLSSPSLLRKMY